MRNLPFKSILSLAFLLATILSSGCSNSKKLDDLATAEQMYTDANKALRTANFQTAISKYQELEARFPFGDYTEQAQLEIAYAYYKYEEQDSAIAAADRFLRLHPQHPHADYAYYVKGLANFNRSSSILDQWFPKDIAQHDQNSLRESYQTFEQLTRRYPDSVYFADARQRMIYLRNKLAEHELTVAEYYLKRKAWLAAANRGKWLIEHYEGAPSNAKALEIMGYAYRQLHLNDLAADSDKILKLNYPDYKPSLKRSLLSKIRGS